MVLRLEEPLTREQVEALARFTADEEVEGLAGAAHRLEAERQALAESRDRLPENDETDAAGRLRELEDGFRCLTSWAAVPGGSGAPAARAAARARFAALALALIASALAIALTVSLHPAWALALIPVAAFAGWAVAGLRAAAADDPAAQRAAFRAEFERLDLPTPEAWTPEGVSVRLRGLAGEILAARTAQHEHEERAALRPREEDYERRTQEHRVARTALEARLGVKLPVDDAWLPLFTRSLRHWQEAHERVVAIDEEIADVTWEHAEHLDRSRALIAGWGEGPPTSRGTLDAALARLRDLDASARDRAARRTKLGEMIAPARAEADAEWAAFFADRGLAEGDAAGLAALLEDLQTKARLDRAIAEADGRARAAGAPLTGAHADLLGLTAQELEAERDAQRTIAARREELVARRAAIEHEIEQARQGTSITDARAALTRAREALLEARQEEERRAVGSLLLERIAGISREVSLPAVFQRAQGIFGRITAGRFQLLPPADEHAGFRAMDLVDGMEKALEELSTGERVQLLLAVRLGFLEHREPCRVPLLLDETLGTSDDERAGAIMDALVEFARDGRQVIYFTAQHDEAGKWKGRLEGGDLDFRVIDLAAIRAGDQADLTPLEIRAVETTRIPAPEGRSHADYGAVLGAPGLHPFRQGAGQVHLWHALEDPDELHAILSRNITTIGQFLNYRRYGGPLPPGANAHTPARIEAAARGLERVFEAWRRGRARPIELQDALETGAVTGTFEERFAELLSAVERDPEALLGALEAGRLGGFRRGNIDKLREAFETGGILSGEERYGAADLELRLRAEIGAAVDDGLVDDTWIRRVIAALPGVER